MGGDGTVEDVKAINVIASQFKFKPASITVAEGDSVRLRLHSTDRTHGIATKAFRVKALIPKTAETVTVEWTVGTALKIVLRQVQFVRLRCLT